MANPSFALSNGGASTDNPTPMRSVYPSAAGATAGAASGPISMVTTGATSGASDGAAGAGNPVTIPGGVMGQPLTWWAALIVLFIALGFVAKKAGNEGEFGNLKVSAYNILMVTLAAIIGIAGMKVLFTRFTVPGISTLVQSV